MIYLVYLGVAFCIWLPFWTSQFAHLMSLPDSEYPSQGDKTRWVVVFILFCIPAPFAYLEWRVHHRVDSR